MRSRRLLSAGDVIAERYKVIEFAGEGGMQEVYLALDLHLRRKVAVKTPKNASADKRFERSAIVSARVNHPNVAKTLDYIPEGEFQFLVEEFIEGGDIKRGLLDTFCAIDPSLVAKILHHIAKGLAASHRAGVVHRDLKPSNVMVVGGPNACQIKITDFGIAKMVEEEIEDAFIGGDPTLSASKTFVGAAAYMAPEVFRDRESVGTPADVWAVGALIYELLSGNPPYGSGVLAIPRILANEELEHPIRFRNRVQFLPLVNDLAEVVLACLKPDPSSRPTAAQLAGRCADLCYTVAPRKIGKCVYIHDNGVQGKLRADDGVDVFFNKKSVYGPMPKIGDGVCFSSFPGMPNPRAHPVLVLSEQGCS